MILTFLGKETTSGQSPTLYATDRESYVVQGWIVTDRELIGRLDLPNGDMIVEVPPALLAHLAADGLSGEVAAPVPPIVHINEEGNYIVQGAIVTDGATLEQINLPDHETCVEIPKTVMALLG